MNKLTDITEIVETAILNSNFKSICQVSIPLFALASILQGYGYFFLKTYFDVIKKIAEEKGKTVVFVPPWFGLFTFSSTILLWLCLLSGCFLIFISFGAYSNFEWLRIINNIMNFAWGLLLVVVVLDMIDSIYLICYIQRLLL